MLGDASIGGATRPPAEGERDFRLLADRLPVPVWWCGPDGRLAYANEAWLAYTGRAPGEELGLGWVESVHPDDRERCLAGLEAALARGEPFALEFRLRRGDGAYRWVQDRGAPVADEAGAVAGYACCAVEIHRQRRLRAGLARVGRALRRRDMLLEELHHRVKNTLQLIGSLLSLLARRVSAGSAPAVREMARCVATFGLAYEALRLSKASAGSVELGPFLSEVTAGLREVARDRQIRVEVRADPAVTLPVGQATPLGLVVNELVTNALKHAVPNGGGSGLVTVEVLKGANGRIEVSVADDGPGLPDDAWPPPAAASLGMPLVAGLARQAGASVSVTREGGTRFALTFPPARARAPAAEPSYSAAAGVGAETAASPGEA